MTNDVNVFQLNSSTRMAAILAFGVVGAAAAYPQTGYFDIGEDCFLNSSGKQDITMRQLVK